MNNRKYIMVGAPIITREIFRNILRPLNNHTFKPSGGFWSSPYINHFYNISDWYTYLMDARSIARYKDLNQSTIFTLKENAKIITIDTKEKVLELAIKYPSQHQLLGFYDDITSENTIFDFEKISQDFDGIYVNFNTISNDTFDPQKETIVFNGWNVNTLLLFNLDCIKEYQTVPIIFNIDNPYSFPYIKEELIGKPQLVEDESNEHYDLAKLTEELYLELMNKFSTYQFKDYDEYLTITTQNAKEVISIIEKNEEKRINEIKALLQSKNMIVETGLIAQNLALNELAQYLTKDEERIKSLSKSKIRDRKTYVIK